MSLWFGTICTVKEKKLLEADWRNTVPVSAPGKCILPASSYSHGHTHTFLLSVYSSHNRALCHPHKPQLLCFCWQGAFVLLHGSAGVGMHYVICGVCLEYSEQVSMMKKGVTIVTHTHDDII